MGDIAVNVSGVWRKFHRGEIHNSLRDLVPALAKRMLSKAKGEVELAEGDFWALKEIDCQIRKGEAVGVIGPNGAGKSTLLKILSRILRPTKGTYSVHGRLGALIEVTAGFHPDLTGRENIYLNGAILGLKQREIDACLDGIIEFSGIGPFIDTPVKRYSSGMQARLGFSVASHLRPEVLLVDEVLSVGDIAFQSRCIERMKEQIARGVAVIFVSHNLQAVAALCSRCLVLNKGMIAYDGPVEAALDAYLTAAQAGSTRWGCSANRFKIRGIRLRQHDAEDAVRVRPHAPCTLSVIYECLEPSPRFRVSMVIERTRDLVVCYDATPPIQGPALESAGPGDVFEVTFSFLAHLARGHYRICLNIHDPENGTFLHYAENVANLVIEENLTYDGIVDVEAQGEMKLVKDAVRA